MKFAYLPKKAKKIACQRPINETNTAANEKWQRNPRGMTNPHNQLHSRQKQTAGNLEMGTYRMGMKRNDITLPLSSIVTFKLYKMFSEGIQQK